jgi:hypothetical protein
MSTSARLFNAEHERRGSRAAKQELEKDASFAMAGSHSGHP